MKWRKHGHEFVQSFGYGVKSLPPTVVWIGLAYDKSGRFKPCDDTRQGTTRESGGCRQFAGADRAALEQQIETLKIRRPNAQSFRNRLVKQHCRGAEASQRVRNGRSVPSVIVLHEISLYIT